VLVLGRDQASASLLHSIFREKTSSALSDVSTKYLFLGYNNNNNKALYPNLAYYSFSFPRIVLFLKKMCFLYERSNFYWPQ
jgi:hypothetical protein